MIRVWANATAEIILQSLNYQTNTLYTLNLHNVISQLKFLKKGKEPHLMKEIPAWALQHLTHRPTANGEQRSPPTAPDTVIHGHSWMNEGGREGRGEGGGDGGGGREGTSENTVPRVLEIQVMEQMGFCRWDQPFKDVLWATQRKAESFDYCVSWRCTGLCGCRVTQGNHRRGSGQDRHTATLPRAADVTSSPGSIPTQVYTHVPYS